MNQLLINNILIPLFVAGIGTVLEIGRRQLKAFLDSKQQLIQKQQEALIQTMGIEQYNKDKQTIHDAVETVEQLGKEFNWEGTIKHSKVLHLIEGKTGLSDTDIYNIIKAAVLEVNSLKNFKVQK